MPGKKLTPRQKKLAAMRAPKGKITRGDVIAAAKKPATKAKPNNKQKGGLKDLGKPKKMRPSNKRPMTAKEKAAFMAAMRKKKK